MHGTKKQFQSEKNERLRKEKAASSQNVRKSRPIILIELANNRNST